MILIIFFIFVERVILIDILNIRRRLVGRIIAFTARTTVGRVTLWIIDILVSTQDVCLHLVIIRAPEIMIVIVCRVIIN